MTCIPVVLLLFTLLLPLHATTDVQQFVAVLQDQEFVVKLENYVNLIQEQAEVIVEYKNLTDALKIEVEVLNTTVQQLLSEFFCLFLLKSKLVLWMGLFLRIKPTSFWLFTPLHQLLNSQLFSYKSYKKAQNLVTIEKQNNSELLMLMLILQTDITQTHTCGLVPRLKQERRDHTNWTGKNIGVPLIAIIFFAGRVAFHAIMTTFPSVSDGAPYVFNSVTTNEGNAWVFSEIKPDSKWCQI